MKIKLIYILVAGVFISTLGACTKDFDTINTNPNSPTEAPLSTVLAFATQDYAGQFFNTWGDMNEPSTYSGHIAKHAYIDEARYAFRPNVVENLWTYSSRQLKNLEIVIERAKEEDAVNMQAAALTMQSMIWMVATDRWRDLPFKDALKGDAGVISPVYTKQEEIYPVLLDRLKEAATLFNENNGDPLEDGDLIFKNDFLKWKKFANSLRLRAAIRVSDIDPVLAKKHIEEITGDATTYPVMESNSDNAFVWWPGSAPYQEPWQADAGSRDDYSMADYLISTLKNLDDPRLQVYAKKNSADEYNGAPVGPKDSDISGNKSVYSRIGDRFRNDASGFSPFMRSSEVQFILAEAAKKNISVGVTAKDAYEKGVRLSLEENDVDQVDITIYLTTTGAFDNTLKTIALQKWISLFKNGQEAWAESRRSDVLEMNAASGSAYVGHNRPPFRYPYPTSETQLNGTNSAQFVGEIKDNFWGKKMWWDTRAGVE